jgi:phage baseplate assembly protein W
MTFLHQPFKLRDQRGAIAVIDDADRHLRDKVLAVLFTAPGERVNNPRFGVGLNRTVFEQLDDLTAAAVEYRIAEGLRRELDAEAEVSAVDVQLGPQEGELLVAISYTRRADRAARVLEVAL